MDWWQESLCHGDFEPIDVQELNYGPIPAEAHSVSLKNTRQLCMKSQEKDGRTIPTRPRLLPLWSEPGVIRPERPGR